MIKSTDKFERKEGKNKYSRRKEQDKRNTLPGNEEK